MRKYRVRSAGVRRLTASVRSRGKPLIGAAAAAVAVTMAPGTASAASAHPAPAASAVSADLEGVDVRSATDGWAVGSDGTSQALIEHWNGTGWKKVASPTLTSPAFLDSVSADSATDAWAVGAERPGNYQTVIEHWNGTSWTRVTSPSGNIDLLTGVTAISSTDAWAVGWDTNSQAVILHWNGTSWTRITSPQPGAYTVLNAVTATSAKNVWAVGAVNISQGAPPQTVIMHFDGKTWTPITTSIPLGELTGVSADSASDAWATGFDNNYQTVVLHWNGTAWTQVPSPTVSVWPITGLTVSAVSPAHVWAVGSYCSAGVSTCPNKTLVLRGSTTSFKQVASPSPGPKYDYLYGVSAVSASNAWAVGYYRNETTLLDQTLILHWNGTSWTKVTSPN